MAAWCVAPLLAVAAVVFLLFAPTYGTITTEMSTGVGGAAVLSSESLLSATGPWILVLLCIPLCLTVMPVVSGRELRRGIGLAAVVPLGIFCLLGLASVGLFFVPSLAALGIVAAINPG